MVPTANASSEDAIVDSRHGTTRSPWPHVELRGIAPSKAGVIIDNSGEAGRSDVVTTLKNRTRGPIEASTVDDAQQRYLMQRASTIGLLMRHCVNLGATAIALAEPDSRATPAGRWLLVVLLGWSLYRLATRSQGPTVTTVDFILTTAICFAIPLLDASPTFYLSNSASQAVAGTAVIGFAVSLPVWLTLPMTLAIAGAYATGSATVVGWPTVWSILAVYYFAVQWLTASLIRFMLLRVAAAVDRARRARESAQMARAVEEAVRTFDREQLALLHDTAASTLLMVGQGVDLPATRLAAQARRDLEVLQQGPWCPTPNRLELVAALHSAVAHVRTPTIIEGRDELWVDGAIAQAVIAAIREAMNNVDRHSRARRARIVVGSESVAVIDDGIGFDQARVARGHGIAESVVARLSRVGGTATVTSAPGRGTMVELGWKRGASSSPQLSSAVDPDRLIDRIRLIYASALTVYSVVNLATTVPYAVTYAGYPVVQTALAATAGICALLALPAIRGRPWLPVPLCLSVLLMVTLIQSGIIVPSHMLGSQADWAQGGIGWCVVVLVLPMRTRRAAQILTAFWVTAGVVEFCRHPGAEALINLGFGTASILGVQLFALAFDGLMRDAAEEVGADVATHHKLLIAEQVAHAVATDYRNRYARLIDNILPLLRRLSAGETITDSMRREARAESRRLRALFDQSRTFEHPLMQQLRPVVDAVENRQVDVTVNVSGDLPMLEDSEAAALVRPLITALTFDMVSAHLVIGMIGESLSLSVVCRGVTDPINSAAALALVDGDVVVTEDAVWLIIERRIAHRSGGTHQ